jgi:4-amino-4-deoxy-L-arabinose transferase-like glycosyltransferase
MSQATRSVGSDSAVRPDRLRSNRGWLLGLVALALVLRLVIVFATSQFATINDSASYDQDAVALASTGSFPTSPATFHGGPTAFHPPLFPVALAGVYKLVGTGSEHARWEAGRVLEAVLGAIAVLLIGLIASRLWGRRTGLIAAGIAAVYPPLILVGSSLLSESLFIPLVLAAVWAALNYRDTERLRWAALAGALTGLGALTRGNGVFLILPVAFLLWTGRPRFTRPALAAPALALVATILMLVPWTIRNLDAFHSFVPIATETGYALEGTYNSAVQNDKRFPALWSTPFVQMYRAYAADRTATEADASGRLTHEALHYIGAHPFSVVKTAYWNTVRLLDLTPGIERYLAPYEGYPRWLAMLSVYSFWALALLCIAGLLSRAARAAPLALWGCPLVIYLSTVPLLGLTRYRSPADPFLIMLAAVALMPGWQRLSGRVTTRRSDVIRSRLSRRITAPG